LDGGISDSVPDLDDFVGSEGNEMASLLIEGEVLDAGIVAI